MTAIVKRLRKPLPTFPIRRRDPSYRLCVRAAWNIGTLQEFVSFALALNEVIPARIKDKHIIPSLLVAVFHHLLKGVAVVVCACCGSVYILIYDQNVVTLGIVVANADLSFDGLFGLPIAAVSRVDHRDTILWTQ